MQTYSDYKAGLEERALTYLENTVGDEPFTVAGIAHDVAELAEPGITATRWGALGFVRDVTRAIRAVMREEVNGHPRYLWTGTGALYQRAEALGLEALAKLGHRDEAMVRAYVEHALMLGRLKAAKTGADEATVKADVIAELEQLLA